LTNILVKFPITIVYMVLHFHTECFWFLDGVELRALHFPHRCSTTWATPTVLYWLFLRQGLAFCQAVLEHDPPVCASLNSWDDRC
jgi:hypothetical protein